MEVLESGEQSVLQWDRKLSELSEPGETEALMYHTHFSELLDEFSQNVLGQLLSDPFLSEKSESMEVEPSPTSPAPLIQAEHSYSLSEEPRTQPCLQFSLAPEPSVGASAAHWAPFYSWDSSQLASFPTS